MIVRINGKEREVQASSVPTGAGALITLSLALNKEPVDTVEVVFPLKEQDCLVYNNGFCTNDFVAVQKLENKVVSRDLVMVRGKETCLSVGMITAESFLTRFITTPEACTLTYFLENKLYDGVVTLEKFVVSETLTGSDFFRAYCEELKEYHHITLPSSIDAGWSSWSYYYRTVDEKECRRQEELVRRHFPWADMIQIDDAWQNGDTFGGDWNPNPETFPTLDQPMGQSRLGLWFAPTMVASNSTLFGEHRPWIDEKRSFGGKEPEQEKDGSVYPLDLESPEVRAYIADAFRNAVEKFNCHYFKIDFLVRSLIRVYEDNGENVVYGHKPSVRAYQEVMHLIRETVRKDAFLVACGAPITESAGVFDAIRVSPDITWTTSNPANHPGFWYIVRRNAQNIFLRSFYHGRVFINDPDALVVRGHQSKGNDLFLPDLEEARVVATMTALSGGSMLINEDLSALEEDRLALAKRVMKPLGIAAEPEDFFEFPLCTRVRAKNGEKAIAAVFNWEEADREDFIKNDRDVLAFDCWTGEFVGRFTGDIPVSLRHHSVRALFLTPVRDGFVCVPDDFSMGLNEENPDHGWYCRDGKIERR